MARRIGAIGRTQDGKDVRMYFDSMASLVICTVATGDVGDDGKPIIIEIGLDELLGQYADEINEVARQLAETGGGGVEPGSFGVTADGTLSGALNFGTVIPNESANTLIINSGYAIVDGTTAILI